MHPEHAASAQLLLRETAVLLSLPEICIRLRGVLDDPGHSRKDIANVMRYDPALTARLLRIVNSAYYALPYRAASISQALGILGEQELKNLVLVTSIMKMSGNLDTRMNIQQFWKHSVYAAVLARNLYTPGQQLARDEYFMAGLLLNIGKLLLYAKAPSLQIEVQNEMAKRGLAEIRMEQELTGTDHTCVGALLANNWNFPEPLVDLIATHHEPVDNMMSEAMPCLMQLVGYFSDCYEFSGSVPGGEQEWQSKLSIDWPAPGFDRIALQQVLETTRTEYAEVYEVFCGDLH
jgi:HD-like signal output (HDOD) protein